jgi:hypothetical protein
VSEFTQRRIVGWLSRNDLLRIWNETSLIWDAMHEFNWTNWGTLLNASQGLRVYIRNVIQAQILPKASRMLCCFSHFSLSLSLSVAFRSKTSHRRVSSGKKIVLLQTNRWRSKSLIFWKLCRSSGIPGECEFHSYVHVDCINSPKYLLEQKAVLTCVT